MRKEKTAGKSIPGPLSVVLAAAFLALPFREARAGSLLEAPNDCAEWLAKARDKRSSRTMRLKSIKSLISSPYGVSPFRPSPAPCISKPEVEEGLGLIFSDESDSLQLRLAAGQGAAQALNWRRYPQIQTYRLLPFTGVLYGLEPEIAALAEQVLIAHFKSLPPSLRLRVENGTLKRLLPVLADKEKDEKERSNALRELTETCEPRHGPCFILRPELRAVLRALAADPDEGSDLRRGALRELALWISLASPQDRLEDARLMRAILVSENSTHLLESAGAGLAFELVGRTPLGTAPDKESALALTELLERSEPEYARARHLALFGLLYAHDRTASRDVQEVLIEEVEYDADDWKSERREVLEKLPACPGAQALSPDLGPAFPLALARVLESDATAPNRLLAARLAGLLKEPPPKLETALKHAAEEDSEEDVRAAARIAKTRHALAAASRDLAEQLADGLPAPR